MTSSSLGPESNVVIVGAGPYGLSIAAHLAPTNLRTRIFGSPMQSWSGHMPRGMKLKSEGFASNLFDPSAAFPLREFCREQNLPYADVGFPIPLETFIAYGIEFQRRFVPHLEQTTIASIQRSPTGFTLRTASGETLHSRNVILATGISHCEHLPPQLAALPSDYVTHTVDHTHFHRFQHRKVAVLGAGASAVNAAALLREAGAEAHIIARAPSIAFHDASPNSRSLLTRLQSPRSGLGVGWKSKLTSDFPLLFHAMPQKLRLRAVQRHLGPAPGWFIRDKVEGLVPTHLNTTIQSISLHNGQLHLALTSPSGPSTLIVDHLIAGTGFKPAISRLEFLNDDLRDNIQTLDDTPILTRHFESTIPGLYFVGLTSANSFGPLTRFACGARFAANQLTKHLQSKSF
jgi:hypothetical protein